MNTLREYANTNTPKYSRTQITAQLSSLKTLHATTTSNLYTSFMKHTDSIFSIIDIYVEVNRNQNELHSLINAYNEIIHEFQRNEYIFVNDQKHDEFVKLLDSFDSDLEYFKSPHRFLEVFGFFEGEGKRFILVMTNDMVFLGVAENEKYRLVCAVFYDNVYIGYENETLIFISQSNRFSMKGQKAVAAVSVYEEYTFCCGAGGESEDEEFSNFVVVTEQFEKIGKGVEIDTKNASIYTLKDLQTVIERVRNKEDFVVDFLKARFFNGLLGLNKVVFLEVLIKDAFSYFFKFYDQQKALLNRLKFELFEPREALLIESQVYEILKFIAKRVFFNYDAERHEKVLKLIENSLNGTVDLRFLMYKFKALENEYQKRCLDSAKNRLNSIAWE